MFTILISTLVMVVLECVVSQRIRSHCIALICYFSTGVEDLKEFFEHYLETVCKYWHEALYPEEAMVSYSMDSLKKTVSLAIRDPFDVRGKNADIVFQLSMKRDNLKTDTEV